MASSLDERYLLESRQTQSGDQEQEQLQALPSLLLRFDNTKCSEARNSKRIWDPKLEKTIRRKFDFHILPWMFILWLFAFLDRSNIGNAVIAGIEEDINLEGTRFNTALTMFHVLYMIVDIPSNWVLKTVGGGRYLPLLCVGWGIITTCMGSVKSFGGLVACRLLLGACEGAFFGGMILYMSMFYKRHEMMARIGIFSSAASLSGAFGGLLSSVLSEIEYGGYKGWSWIFFVEGAATVLFGSMAFFCLPNTPSSAWFLEGHEQWLAAHRLYVDSHGATTSQRVEQERFSWQTARFSILNINTLLMSWNYILILIPIYSFAIFLPSILHAMHYEPTTAQLLTVPPNLLAFLFVLGTAFLSDHIQMRGPLIIGGFTLAAIGYIIQLASSNASVQYAGIFFIGAGVFPCSGLILTWLSNNLAPHYARATGLGFITAIGQLGTITATFTYLKTDEPHYVVGHSISLGAIVLTLIGVSVNMVYIKWENAARQAGKRDFRLQKAQDGHELGYRHPGFRYTL